MNRFTHKFSDPPTHKGKAPGRIGTVLHDWGGGDSDALERLMPLVYRQLRAVARNLLADEPDSLSLSPGELVNEVYLRLADQTRTDWRNRQQFYAVAARLMRRILVDEARRRQRLKRGRNAFKMSLADIQVGCSANETDLLDIEQALQKLAAHDQRQERVVELRFFAGLTTSETATALQISTATVKRDWRTAQRFLRRELSTFLRRRDDLSRPVTEAPDPGRSVDDLAL